MTSPYRRGDRVVLIATTDPDTRLVPGTEGTVTGTDSRHGQIFMAWDDGSTLSMLPGDGDEIRLITQPADWPQYTTPQRNLATRPTFPARACVKGVSGNNPARVFRTGPDTRTAFTGGSGSRSEAVNNGDAADRIP